MKKLKDLTIEELLEEYFIEVKANRESIKRGLCSEYIKQRLKITKLEELKELYPEYFL